MITQRSGPTFLTFVRDMSGKPDDRSRRRDHFVATDAHVRPPLEDEDRLLVTGGECITVDCPGS
jgi:hypothetical protein